MTSVVEKASPWKFGGLSWSQLSRRTAARIYHDDVLGKAAQLSYFFIFALFPLLFFLASLLGYFAQTGTEMRDELLRYLAAVAPRKASVLISDTVDEITAGSSGGKVSFGLLAALLTASFGMGSVISTLNSAYGVKESRPWWKAQALAVALTVGLTLLIISALVLVLHGGHIGEWIAAKYSLGGAFTLAWGVMQWPVVLAVVLLAFALVYYFSPNVKDMRWQWITPGSVLGLALWLLASFIFRAYLGVFDTYGAAYGSLGAMMVLLLWLYLTGVAILVGGEMNAVIEDAAARAGVPEAKERGEKRPDEHDPGA